MIRNPGRFAGLLYLVGSIPGFFALLYVPRRLFVHGNPTATAENLVSHETLFRLGIFADLAAQSFFLLVAFALYNLLKSVNRHQAQAMFFLLFISISISFLSELNSIAALYMARGEGSLATLDHAQRIAWMRLFLNLRGDSLEIAGIFWGLWLFPLGLLVYRAGFIPRIIGALLMIGCFAYLANSFASLVFPSAAETVARVANPIQLAEMIFMLWLLVMGATPNVSQGRVTGHAFD